MFVNSFVHPLIEFERAWFVDKPYIFQTNWPFDASVM